MIHLSDNDLPKFTQEELDNPDERAKKVLESRLQYATVDEAGKIACVVGMGDKRYLPEPEESTDEFLKKLIEGFCDDGKPLSTDWFD